MKNFVLIALLFISSLLLFSRCFLLNGYMKSDEELNEHYKNASVKPIYKTSELSDRKQHYAVLTKSDTLPLLLMVHGAPGAWYGYLNLTDDSLLQEHFKIVAVDRLGYGKSGYGKEELSIETQAMAIKKIIDKENTSNKKVYLLGRSYGAPITAWLAINYPEQFEKLVMVSPVIDPDKEKFYWFSDIGNSALVQWMLPDLLNVATKEKFAHQNEMKKMLPKWENLCTPTYVLVGEDDNVADTANYSFAKKHITNCTAVFMKLKHTGHRITQEQPALVKELLLQTTYCKDQPYMADNKASGKTISTAPMQTTTLKN
jgi:pimeloyl-ACP methyl ester carboxylesterase